MGWLRLVTQLAVEVLAAWTLAVHACMALGLAAAWSASLLALGLAVAWWLPPARGRLRAARAEPAAEHRFAVGVGLLGLLGAAGLLLLLTPSGDDFDFFHRALWQAAHPFAPFAAGDTAFDVPGLPAISPLHRATTWELGTALLGRALGLDPLGFYHNGSVVLVSLLWAAIMALWLRETPWGRWAACVGVAGALLLLVTDDPALRSFGIAWRMLHVGKMVQWLWLFPTALWFAWRYLRAPSPWRLWHPALCAVVAVGLSGTGVFLLPGLYAAASLAGLALRWRAADAPRGAPGAPVPRPATGGFARHALRCFALAAASAYCLGVAGLVAAGVLAVPEDTSAWTRDFPAGWFPNLMLVAGTGAGLLRHAVLALFVPALVLRGPLRRFLVGYTLALVALFTNPVTGPLWIEAARPGSYWRVMLLFPVPLGAGLAAGAAAAALRGGAARGLRLRAAIALVAAIGAGAAARLATPPQGRAMQHLFTTKAPLEVRLPPAHVRLLRPLAQQLEGRDVLAAPGIATSVALLVPGARLEAARLKDTRHAFANAGLAAEGERRVAAWLWAGRCEPWPAGARAAAASVARPPGAPATRVAGGVDALVLRDCAANAPIAGERRRVLSSGGARWREVGRGGGYVVLLRRRGASPRPPP